MVIMSFQDLHLLGNLCFKNSSTPSLMQTRAFTEVIQVSRMLGYLSVASL